MGDTGDCMYTADIGLCGQECEGIGIKPVAAVAV